MRWIVPYSAGGGYDVYSRLLQPFYEDALRARIVIENRGGAGGRLGARALHDAEPDGRTLGIINAYALLVMALSEGVRGLHPVHDYTVLGRIAVADPVWATTPGSRFGSIQDVMAHAAQGPILFGLNGVGGTGFVAASVAAELLGIEVRYVLGYPGTRESSLGLIRGEFDVGAFTFESVMDRVDAGDLVPLLRILDAGPEPPASLREVPLLAGGDGFAAQVARARGVDPSRSVARAETLSRIFRVGRLVVAPPGLAPELADCLAERLATVAGDPAFRASAAQAGRAVSFADPPTVAAELASMDEGWQSLAAVLRRHAALARSGRDVR